MVHRFVKLRFAPKHAAVITPLFEKIAPEVRNFEGCLHLEILFDIRDGGKVITYSHWESEAHLEKYRHSEVFKEFWAEIKPLFLRPAEAWSMKRAIFLP